MANHIPPLSVPLLYFLRLSIVLLLLLLHLLPGTAASALPPESRLEFALRLRAMKGLADRLYGIPTPELDIFATLRVENPADEELCFRRASVTVKHESTSTVLGKGVVPEFCVEAEGERDVGMWAHGERKDWPQAVRDAVTAERRSGELRLQVSLELVDEAGTIEVAVDCTLNQDYTRSNCHSSFYSYFDGY